MAIINRKSLSGTYSMICVFTTIGLIIYAMYRFSKDEDTTLVRVTKFHSSKDAIYPSISFCILQPFLEKQFKVYNDNTINESSYTEFLDGKIWDERFLKVDYDNVTVSLTDYLLRAEFTFNDYDHHEMTTKTTVTYQYVSYRSSKQKCFTIDVPFWENKQLEIFVVNINAGIFQNRKRHSRKDTNWMEIYLHFPGQRFTASYNLKDDFSSRQNKTTNNVMQFNTRNIEVLTRRNRIREPCEEDWRNYDIYVMKAMMKKAGCRPPHWKTIIDLPICSRPDQMKSFARAPKPREIESFIIQPCKVLSDFDYKYEEYNSTDDKQG